MNYMKKKNELEKKNNELEKKNNELEKKYDKYKKKYTDPNYDIYGNDIINFIKSKDKYINHSRDFYTEKINHIESLVIKNDLLYIKDIYNKYNYIELRKYNGEKTLIIGCGNTRLDNRNIEICKIKNECNRIDENKYHSHENCYTIDATVVANPSIIGTFDEQTIFKTIPDHSFNYIIFEGGGDPSSNDIEIKRLLKQDELSYCINNEVIYSYYKEGNYQIITQV